MRYAWLIPALACSGLWGCSGSDGPTQVQTIPVQDAAPDTTGSDASPEDAQAEPDSSQPPLDGPGTETGVDAATDQSQDADSAANPPDALPEAATGHTQVVPGAADRLLISGTIMTPDSSYPGQVLVEGQKITCVAQGNGCEASPGASGATVLVTDGIVSPGLIDTHNHILFDIFDNADWMPSKLYQNHDQWPNEERYKAMMATKHCLEGASQPTWCPAEWKGTGTDGNYNHFKCEMDKWGELKGLIAGTTGIVGLPGTSSGCFASLARSLDTAQNDLAQDKIQSSALFPPSTASADGVCANFADGDTDAYLIHCGEGLDAKSLNEFATLGTVTTTDQCLYAPPTAITHGTAFTAAEFAIMAQHGMKLTWSPQSNISLYGQTTDIPAALDAGVLVSLGPDWSMGGSVNLLDELRFADAWDNQHWNDRLTPQDLFRMVTVNAAKVAALDDRLGDLKLGYYADLFIFYGDPAQPYASLLQARPQSIALVMVGGKVLYGDTEVQPAAPTIPGCEALDVCGVPKFVCVAEGDHTIPYKLDQTLDQIKTALETALTQSDQLTPDGYDFAPLAPLANCQ